MGMRGSFDRLKLCPGQELVRRNQSFTHFSGWLGNHFDPLSQPVLMRQEKVQIKPAGIIEDSNRRFQMAAFSRICSSLTALGEIKEQFRGAAGLSHWFPPSAHIP